MEQDSVNKISQQFDVNYDPSLHENIEELGSQIASVDAIIVRNKTQLNEALLTKARKLRFVGRLGVGLDNIDTDYCSDKSIVVQPATGMNADSVAEYVISCSLSLLKKYTSCAPRNSKRKVASIAYQIKRVARQNNRFAWFWRYR